MAEETTEENGIENGRNDRRSPEIELESYKSQVSLTENASEHSVSPVDESDLTSDSERSRKRQKQQEEVLKQIAMLNDSGGVTLDLCNRCMKNIPDELLNIRQLEYLYLENNELTCLPDNFFDCFPNLKWLDLRRNYLVSLPTAFVGRHKNLKTLLLEGNELRTLPLELGLIPTLQGLNLRNNPLEFPPQEVLACGAQTVLAFFREMLRAKSQGLFPMAEGASPMETDNPFRRGGNIWVSQRGPLLLWQVFVFEEASSMFEEAIRVPQLNSLQVTTSDDASETEDWSVCYNTASKKLVPPMTPLSKAASWSNDKHLAELIGPVPHSASLHTVEPPIKKKEKCNRTPKKSSGKKSSSKVQWDEEKRLKQLKELREKQELVLQRRKDAAVLREFQEEGKILQRKKQLEKLTSGKIDYDAAVETAPYGYDERHLRMETNEERIAENVKKQHALIRRVLSPNSVKKLEESRAQRDQALGQKIKEHTQAMVSRRHQKNKLTPQQEMEAAQKELQIAQQLQEEVASRRKDLEYRFRAFTGDAAM